MVQYSHSVHIDPETIIARTDDNTFSLIPLPHSKEKKVIKLETPFVAVSNLKAASERLVVCTATTSFAPSQLVSFDPRQSADSEFKYTVLKESSSVKIDSSYISAGEEISFPTDDGSKVYAIFYGPKNAEHSLKQGELAPSLLRFHGGPTSAAPKGYSSYIQFYTSRGWNFVDVDYRGSTGYGKHYRDALRNNWGVVDTADAAACAKYLAEAGYTPKGKIAIEGGSAGGFTVLATLCQYPKAFSAGANSYGVSDLKALADDTQWVVSLCFAVFQG